MLNIQKLYFKSYKFQINLFHTVSSLTFQILYVLETISLNPISQFHEEVHLQTSETREINRESLSSYLECLTVLWFCNVCVSPRSQCLVHTTSVERK